MTDKEKIAKLIDKCIVDLIMSAGRVNEYKKENDLGRNHTNYGIASKAADVLIMLGKSVDIACYGDGEYLLIPKVTIDGRVTKFQC